MYDIILLGCDRLLNWLVDVNGWISKLSVLSRFGIANNNSHSEGEMKDVKNLIFGLFHSLKCDARRVNENLRGKNKTN